MPTDIRYRIRAVDGEDEFHASELRDLHELTFGKTAPQIEPRKGGDWWLVYRGEEAVGFAGLKQSFGDAEGGYLYRSGVLPEHRGRGLQLRLIRAREALARRYGWRTLYSDTTDNPASSNTLIRAGYRLFAPAAPWAFKHSLYWRKAL